MLIRLYALCSASHSTAVNQCRHHRQYFTTTSLDNLLIFGFDQLHLNIMRVFDVRSSLHVHVILLSLLVQIFPTQAVAEAAATRPSPASKALYHLYDENTLERLYRIAKKGAATGAITKFPQYTTLGSKTGNWEYFKPPTWTSGFFTGSLWQIYERQAVICKSSSSSYLNSSSSSSSRPSVGAWKSMASKWASPALAAMQFYNASHDVGFLLLPSFRPAYTLLGNATAKSILLNGAAALASRYNSIVGCTRSWQSSDPSAHFLVIMDNMMNIDLLFWASEQQGGNATWKEMAHSHALKTMQNHIRPDYGSYHVVDYNPISGAVQAQYTAQGYLNSSTWARGQAWGIYGFANAYSYTNDSRLLQTSIGMADYFIHHMPSDNTGVPNWDFNAPIPTHKDTSAATIAASGMLLLGQLLNQNKASSGKKYISFAQTLLQQSISQYLASPIVSFASAKSYASVASNSFFDAILTNATINNNAKPPLVDQGVVYADYYLLEAGNRMLKMGLYSC